MAVDSSSLQQWQQKVLELTQLLQERGDPALLWGVEVTKCLLEAGLQVPSVDLGHLLISNLCWSNNGPMLWKYIEQAMRTQLLNSLHILALLTFRYLFGSALTFPIDMIQWALWILTMGFLNCFFKAFEQQGKAHLLLDNGLVVRVSRIVLLIWWLSILLVH